MRLTGLDGTRIAVIGLGYVGLPLAIEFGTRYPTVGFDISSERIDDLQNHKDHTLEMAPEDFIKANYLTFSTDPTDLRDCNVYIVTVPTPIDQHKSPDMAPLLAASATIAAVLCVDDVVIYESTVYPGATEEVCVPEIERLAGLKFNEDFFAGYSPERLNPGDKNRRLPSIVKVTSGSTPQAADFVDSLYASIITAGTHRASSIAVAEAAKVIENTQRDVNIALVNELALIFQKLGIDTGEVLAAAATKWNFLPFQPGLVGGHCVGVDPYYLTHKAEAMGYHPEVILAGRRINDNMGSHIASRVLQLMAKQAINMVGARVLVLGFAFKENCPDVRNTKVIDVIAGLREYHLEVDVYDPWVDADAVAQAYDLNPITDLQPGTYDAVILAVAHEAFNSLTVSDLVKPNNVVFDTKHVLPHSITTERL